MSEFKGNTGNWLVENMNIKSESGSLIAEIWNCGEDEDIHNANLIAAAPDLLEALQVLIKGYEHCTDYGIFDLLTHGDEIEAAVNAINKALGKGQ